MNKYLGEIVGQRDAVGALVEPFIIYKNSCISSSETYLFNDNIISTHSSVANVEATRWYSDIERIEKACSSCAFVKNRDHAASAIVG